MTMDDTIKCNDPYIKFDKGTNDLSILMTEFSSNDTTSNVSLNFRTYNIDATSIPDFTNVNDLNIGDIVHVYGYNLNETYIVESYIVPDNTNITQSEVYKISFKTATGVCSTPVVVRDDEYGE